jgi:hypothetical protein
VNAVKALHYASCNLYCVLSIPQNKQPAPLQIEGIELTFYLKLALRCSSCNKGGIMAIGFDEIQVEETDRAKIVTLKINQSLDKEDYESFVPLIETQMRARMPIRVLIELHAFKGWTAGALWEETKFAAKHFSDLERIAVVGESRWEKGIKLFVRPFTAAKVRFFGMEALDQARRWIEED